MRYWYIYILLFISYSPLFGGHIIGGDVTYRCLGNGNYEITMIIYRDCFCVNCADFDMFLPIGIYACGNNVDCRTLNQASAIRQINVPLLGRRSVPAPEYPCQETPPNLCVEEATYRFVLSNFGVSLPESEETYYIVYQRCCRNETINNILAPRTAGATFYAEISPESQRTCNNSPVFNDFPPTVICARTPLEFDHSASDAEGDSLAYRFCAPVIGGGLAGSNELPGIAAACNGIIPSPGCPPPFIPVSYAAPFSATNPMMGDPMVTIDPITGIISGTPDLIGQFVVGVCVDEFRDGELIGTLRRDFQFNTAGCSPTVQADIEAEIVDGQRYFVKSCGSNTVTFINQSVQQRFIREYIWEFPQGNPTSATTRDATITFPDTGSYVGKMIINPGLPCADSLDIFLDVFPEIAADFEFDYDTCVSGEVNFRDLSFSGSGQITSWNWDLADLTRKTIRNHDHEYTQPGEYLVELIVEDVNTCRDSIKKLIRYFPVPEEVIIEPDRSVVCDPGNVTFFNLSEPINESYIINWDFGDGKTGTGISPTHTYDRPGNYTVKVTITSPIGCSTSAEFPNVIDVRPTPIADFDYTPTTLTTFQRTADFRDRSQGAAFWEWFFGNDGTSNTQNPRHTFSDTGIYEVTLVVTHPEGCMDTITKILDVEPRVSYFLPNAFTPNGDGLNDFYLGTGVMAGMTDFNMTIWNRWGEIIFETEDPNQGWNGSKFNNGPLIPSGVYVCLVKFKDPRGIPQEIKGFATLVR